PWLGKSACSRWLTPCRASPPRPHCASACSARLVSAHHRPNSPLLRHSSCVSARKTPQRGPRHRRLSRRQLRLHPLSRRPCVRTPVPKWRPPPRTSNPWPTHLRRATPLLHPGPPPRQQRHPHARTAPFPQAIQPAERRLLLPPIDIWCASSGYGVWSVCAPVPPPWRASCCLASRLRLLFRS